ncbi:MAG: hypothetical protein Tsb0019_38440 [Roseibium sp.]
MGQLKSITRRSGGKRERTIYAVIAGATLLMSGFAAAAVFSGASLSPEDVSIDRGTARELTLARPAKSPASTDAVTAPSSKIRISVAASAAHMAAQPSATSVSVDLGKALKDTEARETAKVALAAKLAKLKLARTLLAARAASGPTEDPAETPARAAAPTVRMAALHGVGTIGHAATGIEPAPHEREMAGLVTTPEKPGAILPPTPDVKPEPPRRAAKPQIASRPAAEPEDASPVLAYARPGNPQEEENGVFGGLGKLFGGPKGALPGPGSRVAVYDISAATVHMPDGTKLEAHSGIGHRMDNPKYAHVRMAGPTPPNVYRLRMRERRFHGVEAIRMLPVDRAAMKGRDGMLTHTRLLRNSIGSHGCVAFKDYNKFLNAFKAGKVKTLIVVPSMEKLPTYVAMMERAAGA